MSIEEETYNKKPDKIEKFIDDHPFVGTLLITGIIVICVYFLPDGHLKKIIIDIFLGLLFWVYSIFSGIFSITYDQWQVIILFFGFYTVFKFIKGISSINEKNLSATKDLLQELKNVNSSLHDLNDRISEIHYELRHGVVNNIRNFNKNIAMATAQEDITDKG